MPFGTTFCDVGGGIGTVSMRLAKAYSNLKITLQDQPSVIEHARTVRDLHLSHPLPLKEKQN